MFEHSLFVLNIGLPEILLFGGILILVFGASQIPKIARSLGEGLKEFKKSVKEAKDMDEDEDGADTDAASAKKGKQEKAKTK